MEVRLPDGTVIEGIPEGTTKEQLYEKLQGTQYASAFGDWKPEPVEPPVVAPPVAEPAQPPMMPGANPFMDYAGEVASNVPGSAMNVASGFVDAATSPVETAKAIGGTIAGIPQALARRGENVAAAVGFPGAEFSAEKGQFEPYAEAAGSHFVDRYGGVDEALETVKTDPVGALMDVTGVVAPFAPKVAAFNPAMAASRGGARGLGKLADTAAETVMESAIKPSTLISTPERSRLVNTALDYGINPSTSGVQKLGHVIRSLSDEVGNLVSEATAQGGTLPASYIFKYLDDLRTSKGGPLLDAADDLKIIDGMEQKLRASFQRTGKDSLSARDLQDIKLDLDKKIDWTKPGKIKQATKMETRANLRGAAREGVAELVPEVGGKNEQLSRLFELEKPLQRAETRIGNRNIIGMGDFLSMGGGLGLGAATGNPLLGGALWAGSELLTNPRISPTVARGIKSAGAIPKAIGGALESNVASRTLPLMMIGAGNDEIEDPIHGYLSE